MPETDTGTDMPEMRTPLVPVESDTSEDMSEMQESLLERETYSVGADVPTPARFRVREYEFGNESKLINLEYYDDYFDAMDSFDEMCNDDAFINRYGKMCTVELSKRITGYANDTWEVISQSLAYPN